MARKETKTGGREAIEGHIPGQYALAVGMPPTPAPSGWQWTKLTDVARLESGHTPSRKKPEYWGGNIPWVGIRDATANHGTTINDTNQHTNDLGIANSSARVLPTNTVCLSRTASVGYVIVMGNPMATSQDFVNWVCSDKLDHHFLKYVLVAENKSFKSFSSGTTHQTIYFPEVKAFHICLPPLAEQKRIAGILSAYDDLIENNLRRIKILEDMAQSLYREWFVHFRYPGHESTPLTDSPQGPIPQGWAVKKLGEITSKVGSGATPKGGKDAYKSEGISLIRSLNIFDYEFKHENLAFIDEDQASKLNNVSVEPYDVLLNITGASVARCTMVPTPVLPARVNQHVAIIRANQSGDPFYILDTINSDERKRQILALAQGGATREALTKTTLTNLEITLPPSKVLQHYSAIRQSIFEQAQTLASKNQNLRTTRDLLLPKLLTPPTA